MTTVPLLLLLLFNLYDVCDAQVWQSFKTIASNYCRDGICWKVPLKNYTLFTGYQVSGADPGGGWRGAHKFQGFGRTFFPWKAHLYVDNKKNHRTKSTIYRLSVKHLNKYMIFSVVISNLGLNFFQAINLQLLNMNHLQLLLQQSLIHSNLS